MILMRFFVTIIKANIVGNLAASKRRTIRLLYEVSFMTVIIASRMVSGFWLTSKIFAAGGLRQRAY